MSDTPGKSLEQPVQGDGYNDDAEAGRKAVADLAFFEWLSTLRFPGPRAPIMAAMTAMDRESMIV